MIKKYYSIYRGIIIQNNDKNHAGQVKVWVPSVSPTVYNGFRNVEKNKQIKLLGANVQSDLTADLIEELRIILPWASLGLPITNEGSSGRYNYRSDTYNSGDGYDILNNDKNNIVFSQQNNNDNIERSEALGAIFEDEQYAVNDAFNGENTHINKINPNSYNYKPSTYSNKSKGEYGIPNVGAHVVVQFFEGDPQFPFITHMLYGKDDWDGLYSNEDYPGSYENNTIIEGEYNHNIDKYRSKYILNQKGGTIEIVNTDHNEKMKLTHFSGSFKEFNNYTNIEFAPNNDQKLVQKDKFLTVRGSNNTFIDRDNDKTVLGDDYEKIGNLNWQAAEMWKAEVAEIADYKQLFDIKRCDADNIIRDTEGNIIAKFNSILQSKSGSSTISPNIKSINTVTSKNDSGSGKEDSTALSEKPSIVGYDPSSTLSETPSGTVGSVENGIVEDNPSSMNGVYAAETLKEKIQLLYQEKVSKLIDIEKKMGLGGSKVIQITKDKVETIGTVMNDYGSIRIDSVGKMYNAEMNITEKAAFSYAKPSPLIEYVNVQSLPGGNYTLEVCDRFNVLVGAGGLNLKSYGSVNMSGTITNVSGEQVNIGSKNEINIESDGRVNISADILVLRQKNQRQVMIDSTLGVSGNIILGGSQYIEGELFLQHVTAPCEYQVTMPQLCMAGMPTSTAAQDAAKKSGAIQNHGGFLIGTTSPSIDDHVHEVYITVPNCIEVYSHSHVFPNLPLTLKNSSEEVRKSARDSGIIPGSSELATSPAQPLSHCYKGV